MGPVGYILYAAPEGDQSLGEGIFRLDALTLESQTIVSGYHATNKLAVGREWLVARVTKGESSVAYELIQVDLRNLSVSKIPTVGLK